MSFPNFYCQIDTRESQERVRQEGVGFQNGEAPQIHAYFFKIYPYYHMAKILIYFS